MSYDEIKYKAFISYSHHEDKKFSSYLQHSLEIFSKKWYQIRRIKLFRDETNLSVTPSLWGGIEKALNQSEYFIYLASPSAAKSKWVKKEIQWWKDNKDAKKIILVLTSGSIEWNDKENSFNWNITDSLPQNLNNVFTNEPLFVDMKWVKNSKTQLSTKHPRFLDNTATLSSSLLNIDKEQLIGFSVTQRKRRNIIVSTFIALLVFLSLIASISSYSFFQKKQEAEASLKVSQERLKDAVGVYWLYLLISDYSDGKIDKNKSLDKILSVLQENDPERIIKVASLMENYISLKGAIFDEKKDKYKNSKTNISLPIFTDTYTSIYSRKPEYTTDLFILEAPYIISTWNDEEIKSLYLLLETLLDGAHPKIFKRYGKSMTKDEYKKLKFMSLILKSSFEKISEESIIELINSEYFLNYFNNVYYWSFFLNENMKENGEIIRGYGIFSNDKFPDLIPRIGRISENLYSYVSKLNSNKGNEFHRKIIDFSVDGIYFLDTNTKIDSVEEKIAQKNNPNWILSKAKELVYLEKYDQASDQYREILSIRENDYHASLGIANIYLKKGEHENFIKKIDDISNKWPTEKEFLSLYKNQVLNVISDTKHDLKKMIKNIESNTSSNYKIKDMYMNLSNREKILNNYNEAIKYLKKSIPLLNQDNISYEDELLEIYVKLSWINILNKNFNESLEYSKKANEIDQNNIPIKINLLNGYALTGNLSGAEKIYKINYQKKYQNSSFYDLVKYDIEIIKDAGINYPDIDFNSLEHHKSKESFGAEVTSQNEGKKGQSSNPD